MLMEKIITDKGIIDKKWTPVLEPYNLKFSLPVLIDESKDFWYYILPCVEGLEPPKMSCNKIKRNKLNFFARFCPFTYMNSARMDI